MAHCKIIYTHVRNLMCHSLGIGQQCNELEYLCMNNLKARNATTATKYPTAPSRPSSL